MKISITKTKESANQDLDDIKEEKRIGEIVYEGDRNQPLTIEETKIYLKHLIANKNSYIDHAYNYKYIWSSCYNNPLKNWEIAVKIISIAVSSISLLGCLIGIFKPEVLISSLKALALIDIPSVIFLMVSKRARKRNATKTINNKIEDLQNSLALEEPNKLDKHLSEIKEMILASTVPTREYSRDPYIAMIQKDIEKITEIKYPGYIADLEKLCTLTEEYMNEKKSKKTTKSADVLSSTYWFDPLLKIEAKLPNASKIKTDQSDILEALKQMRKLLESEKLRSQEFEETSGYTPTLRL